MRKLFIILMFILGLPILLLAQPANDDCAGAITVVSSGACVNVDNTGATQSLAATATFGTADDDVWFSFTAEATTQYVSVTASGTFNPVIQLFSGTCGALTSINNYNSGSSTVETAVMKGLTIGQTYYYRVYHFLATAPSVKTFTTCIKKGVVNDEPCSAIVVNPDFGCNSTTATIDSATQTIPALSGAGTASQDVWFSFVAEAASQTINVTEIGTGDFNPVIELFSSTSCSALTSLGYKNALSTGVENYIATGLTIGQTYYYRVYNNSSSAPTNEDFTTCVVNPPINDEPCSAIALDPGYVCSSTPATVQFATQTMTATTGSPNQDVWFSFVAEAQSQGINVTAIGTGNFNPVIQLFSSTSCSALTSLGYKNTLSTGIENYQVSGLTIGQTYYYRVYNYLSTTLTNESFTTCVMNPPINDEPCNAIVVDPDLVCNSTTATIQFATQTSAALAGAGNASQDVWFSFVAEETIQTINVTEIVAGDFDPVIQLFSSTSCSALTSLGYKNVVSVGSENYVATGLTIGQTYYYRVYNNSATAPTNESFTTCVVATPIIDDCSGALLVDVKQVCEFITYSNLGATNSSTGITCFGSTPYNDVWFKTVVPSSGKLSVMTDTINYEVRGLAVYTGTCGALVQKDCAINTSMSSVSLYQKPQAFLSGLTPGDTVFIRIWASVTTGFGSFEMCVSTPPDCVDNTPAADKCSDAIHMCNLNGYCGNTKNYNATTDPDGYTADNPGNLTSHIGAAGMHNNSWIKFTASETSASFTVYVYDCKDGASSKGIQIGVYDAGCSDFVEHITPFFNPASNISTVLDVKNLIVGNDYLIMIDGNSGEFCYYTIATASGVKTVNAGNDTTICANSSITLSATSPETGSTFTWKKRNSSGTSTIGTTNPMTVTATENTTYIVEVTGGLLCSGIVDSLIVSVTVCDSTLCPTAVISYTGSPWCTSASAQNVTLTGTNTYTGGKYTASPAGLSIDSISGQITPATSSAGNYTVTYTIAASGSCASTVTATTTVAITKAPTASITYSSGVFCTSLATAQPVTLTGTDAYTGGAYTVSPSGLSMNASGAITPSTSTPASYVVTYTYPASGGCPSGTDTTHVTIAALPSVVISYTASPYCSSLTLPQAVTLVGSTGGTYTTTAGLTLNATTGAVTPSSSIAGTSYVVTYSVGATGGCPAVSDTANVFIAEAPSATISYASSPYCSTLTTTQAVTFAGTTGGTYSVLPSGLTMDASGGITPSTSTAGSYVVTYTTPSVAGCAAVSDTANVTITTAPMATISYAASPYCTSLNTPQIITFTGTTGGTYSALPTGLSMNAAGAITPSISTAGAYVVTYTIAASAGCAAVSDTANVTITAAPTAKISYSSAIFCTALATAQPVTLTGTNAYTGGSYSSLPSGLSMDGAGAITPSTSTPQMYTITYSYPASGGCAAGTADTTVTIAAIPTADIIYSGSPYCTTLTTPQSVTFTGTTGGSYSTTGGLTLNPSDGAITPSTSTAGIYVVTYAILAAGGCPAVSDTANVTINGKPTIAITGVNSICIGESTTLKASGATSYVWDNTLTTDSITVTPIQNTTYKVTGTALGCSDTASYAVAIKPLPTLSIQGVELLCIGDSIQLAATGGDSYLWSPQATLSSSSLATVKAFPQTPTTYTLVGTLNGCMDSITHTISVYALPIISLSSPTSGCEPLRVDFSASSTPQLQSISWNFGNGSTSTTMAPNALYLNDGVYDVSANVTDVNGCKSDTTEVGFVTVYPKPVVDFTYTPSQGMVNEPVTFTSSYTQTPATWMWLFGDGNTQSNPVSIATYSYVVSKTYTVTHIVQTDQGCKDTAFRQIVVLTRITIPNVLTPNNDGFNDTFIIDGLQFVEGAKMKIYNRWGRKVYESDSYQNDWDGGNCSEGVYYYVLTLPDFLKLGPYSGSVTLFRN